MPLFRTILCACAMLSAIGYARGAQAEEGSSVRQPKLNLLADMPIVRMEIVRSVSMSRDSFLSTEDPRRAAVVFGTELALVGTAIALHVASDAGGMAPGASSGISLRRDALILAASALVGVDMADFFVLVGATRHRGLLAPLATIKAGGAIVGIQGTF